MHRPDTCCFIGHRSIDPGETEKIKTRIKYIIDPMLQKGVKFFGVGGNVGFDMLAAEYILYLRDVIRKKIKLILVLPYPNYFENREETDIRKEKQLIQKADKVVYVSQLPSAGAEKLAADHLLAYSLYCVTYCHKSTGRTADAVKAAFSQNISVHNASSWDIGRLQQKPKN